MSKTWFITGASKGFGREWTEAALERGDRVAATARKTETLDALVETYGDAVLPLQLAAWLVRGIVFEYLALAALGAYLSHYRWYHSAAPPKEIPDIRLA